MYVSVILYQVLFHFKFVIRLTLLTNVCFQLSLERIILHSYDPWMDYLFDNFKLIACSDCKLKLLFLFLFLIFHIA